MLIKPYWFTLLAALVLTQPGAEDKAKKDLDLMQGTWVMQALEVNGKEVPPARVQGTILTVKGDDYRTKVKDMEVPGLRLKLDPRKDPKEVDMISVQPDGTEKVLKGIYLIEKNTLKICRGLGPEQGRPNQFATWPDTNCFVVTWKRQEK